MRSTQRLALAAGAVLLAVTAALAAGEAENPEIDLKAALKGFKGFLVGELVKADDDGVVVRVRAVTLVEGNAAANPGLLVGRETPVRFATVKDDAGQERPDPGLAKAVKHVGRMPAVAFGGMNGPAMVVMGGDGGVVNVTQHRVQMRVNDMDIRFEEDEADPAQEPKGPLFTGRVQAAEDGTLTLDRLMPGSAPGHTWAAMPTLRFREAEDVPQVAAGVEAVALKAREKAMTAQAKALARHLEVLEKQLKLVGEREPEQARQLREQQQNVHAQLGALKAQIAALREAGARHKLRGHGLLQRVPHEAPPAQAPPPKAPDQTDF